MRKMASWIQLSRGLVSAMLLLKNGLCIFLALCSFGFGIVDLRILKQYGEEQASGTAAGDVIVMVASLMLIAVAVIGCVGVVKKNLKCLYMYVGLLMILVVLEMMIAIFVALQRYGLQFRITEWIREDFFRNVTGEDRSMHERSWDELQTDIPKMLKLIILAVSVALVAAHHDAEELHTATVFLLGTNVHGTVNFSEQADGRVRVQGTITGMPAGEYGFHVHEKGDISGGCGTTGSHFNPEKKDHGHPTDSVRHVGDLGNVIFSEQGVSNIDFVDSELALRGSHNIIGRAVVLHEREDDFGRTQHPDSRTTGNAGGRVACGVIGLL